MPKRQPQQRGEIFIYPDEQVNCSLESWYSAETYWRRSCPSVRQQADLARSTDKILQNTCAGRGNRLMHDAAILSEIVSGAFNGESIKMPTIVEKTALKMYFDYSNLDVIDRQYVLASLADRIRIEAFLQEQMSQLYLSHTNTKQFLVNSPFNKSQIKNPRAWDLSEQAIIDVNKLFTLADNINLESLLIRAAQNLAYMRQLISDPENIDKSVRILRIAAETESLLAPVMEIIGFHKMAMELNDLCIQIRLHNSGNSHVLAAAKHFLDTIPSGESLNQEATKIIQDLFGYNYHEDVTGIADSEIFMRQGLIEPDTMPDKTLRLMLRRKTLGSTAKKLVQFNTLGYQGVPMDILGTTIIAEDESQIPALFSRALLGVTADPAYRLQPSPSRPHAIHVQGTDDFLSRLPLSAIEKQVGPGWKPKPSDGFQVAKITFYYGDIPCEVQVITEAGRVENNLGERTSHVSYKARKSARSRQAQIAGTIESTLDVDTTGWGEKLVRIHARRGHMDEVAINGQTVQSAQILDAELNSNSPSFCQLTEKLKIDSQ
jgi:hypothetical protein